MQHTLTLRGESVTLYPLEQGQLTELRERCCDPAIWEFTFQTNPFVTQSTAQAWLNAALADPGTMAFAVIDNTTGAVTGSTRYLEIDAQHRKLEIGWTFYAPQFWRTRTNTETKYLLLRHAFEQLDCARVQFKAEAVNARSHAAVLRLGAVHEGCLRQFRIRPDGEVRDVNVYSIVAREWPETKARLEAMLGGGVSRAVRSPDSRAVE